MYRNDKLLKLARHSPCQICEIQDDTIVAAHSNQLRDGKGRGLKSSDAAIAFLCYKCHNEIDQGSNLSKQQRFYLWDEAHIKSIRWLIEKEYLIVNNKL